MATQQPTVVRRFQGTLTPAIVATIVAAEQSFVVGPGDLSTSAAVFVTKPTINGAISVCQARVIDATHVGITFVNPTAAGVTPTAGEVYQFVVVD
jgi:hypothetical protein